MEHVALKVTNFRLRESLRNQSIRGPLTGMFNRRHAEASLERELHRAARQQLSGGILMIDVDRFKSFNDSFGHEVGDALLCRIAEYFHEHLRGEDIACRYGGEEFLVVFRTRRELTSRDRAEELRRRGRQVVRAAARRSIEAVDDHLDRRRGCTPITVWSQPTSSAAADVALYQAESGRTRSNRRRSRRVRKQRTEPSDDSRFGVSK